ncbi:MAG: TIGR03560 family F420-dependent LLM class oxidoreductase [Actinomycetota bacterium]
MTGLHFGALVPQGWKGEFDGLTGPQAYRTMCRVAQDYERLGYDSIWLYDHFHSVPPPARPTPVFECWTGMMALAERTTTVRIGQMVTCTPYRNAAHLAKISACVDVASGGRLEMGVGAGWYHQEFAAYGYEFPSAGARIGYLADTVEILKRMWRDEAATYAGRYASVTEAYCDPKPVQTPRPPLWIGGGGERKTLRVVAEHADYANLMGPVEMFARKRDVLRTHCEAVGRDPAEIGLTLHLDCLVARDEAGLRAILDANPSLWGQAEDKRIEANLIGTVSQVIDKIGRYRAEGAMGFIVWFPDSPDGGSAELFASEVIPALR